MEGALLSLLARLEGAIVNLENENRALRERLEAPPEPKAKD
jgi:hypothetical protein